MARKIVKPTHREKGIIRGRLQRKYPQMYESAITSRERSRLKGLSPGDRKEMERMVGKKLKKLYGGKR
ncbi:hypothetical protein KA005_32595 [bacterium]|nr:hypothetical protein [bacterium]